MPAAGDIIRAKLKRLKESQEAFAAGNKKAMINIHLTTKGREEDQEDAGDGN